jgi:hypothetical protein
MSTRHTASIKPHTDLQWLASRQVNWIAKGPNPNRGEVYPFRKRSRYCQSARTSATTVPCTSSHSAMKRLLDDPRWCAVFRGESSSLPGLAAIRHWTDRTQHGMLELTIKLENLL